MHYSGSITRGMIPSSTEFRNGRERRNRSQLGYREGGTGLRICAAAARDACATLIVNKFEI